MIFEINGFCIDIIDDDDRMAIHMAAGDGYEHKSLQAWFNMVKRGRVALDVGAYTGLFSILAKMRGADVIAFEPMPANRWRLGINVARNKHQITVMPVALSDKNGAVTMHYNAKVPLTTGASLEDGITAHNTSIKVDCCTLDSLNIKNVAAIKIDVERHEPCVLRGGMRTIERDRPSLLIETLDDDMRNEILHMLPRYIVAAELDGRNTLFIPK